VFLQEKRETLIKKFLFCIYFLYFVSASCKGETKKNTLLESLLEWQERENGNTQEIPE